MNLYRMNARMDALLSSIEEGGELTEQQILLAAEIEAGIPRAFELLCRAIRETNLGALSARQEAQWFTTRARQQEDANARLKEALLNLMRMVKVQDTRTELFSVRIQKSPPALRVEEGFDPKTLIGTELEPLTVTKVTLNAEAVKARWKDNPDALPDGLSVVQGDHVRISPR